MQRSARGDGDIDIMAIKAAPPAVGCKDLSRDFEGRRALLPVSFSIEEGGHLVIQGPTGSGKTTLLRLLAGLLYPSTGHVLDGGIVVNRPGWRLPPHRRRIGMLFQGLALWPHMTVREQVEFSLPTEVFPARPDRRRAADRVLADAGILPLAPRLPRELSGGEKQRAAWARAVAGEPRLLFLDEPLTSLDPLLREELLQAVIRYGQRPGTNIVLVTHDAQVAERLGYRILRLEKPG